MAEHLAVLMIRASDKAVGLEGEEEKLILFQNISYCTNVVACKHQAKEKTKQPEKRGKQAIKKRACVMGNGNAGIFDCFENDCNERVPVGSTCVRRLQGDKQRARLQA